MSGFWTPGGPAWTLTFDEEFSGAALDPARWGVPNGTPDRTYTDYLNATFSAANISVGNGVASLRVTDGPSGFQTCSMTSTFRQTFGYWEARIKPPCFANGIACGFWLDAAGWTFPEIDILEWLGVEPTVNHTTWHYATPNDGSNGIGVSFSAANPQVNLCGAFHVYGMLWSPGIITWFLDGVPIARTGYNVNAANAVPQQIILDATVGGWGINKVDPLTQFPAVCLVDYVHVYSSDPAAVAVTPDPGYGGPGAT